MNLLTNWCNIHEAQQPKIPLMISPKTFLWVRKHLDAVHYSGPVGLSCDDTKLLSGLRMFWDTSKQKYLLVGGINGPLEVADPEQVQAMMDDPVITKGTKICLWVVQIPLPKMMLIVVAVFPISDWLKVPELLKLLEDVVSGLIYQKINVISYACDGTETERSVQQTFAAKAEYHIEHEIPSPRLGLTKSAYQSSEDNQSL
ncbi:hypothetical protein L208DRAFT_1318783 [Tricholoma matsutake]|nr:hypothetical protein L208DRAFT_1331154 [Tricholoma matsutake 945]KAF8223094.1 hypothetical protein L208DRAFT_1318783 [Tricholoma matsutake 945]